MSENDGETKALRERLRSRTRPHLKSRQLRNQDNKRSKVEKKQRQNAQNTIASQITTPHLQATPPVQQPLCVVSLLDSKGAHERAEEAAGHGELESLPHQRHILYMMSRKQAESIRQLNSFGVAMRHTADLPLPSGSHTAG